MNIKEISQDINKNANQKGFWDNENIIIARMKDCSFFTEEHIKAVKSAFKSQKLLLIVSEISEAMESDRKDNYCLQPRAGGTYNSDEHFLNNFENNIKDTFEDELADATIRIFDLAENNGIDLEKHIEAKNRYNKTRPKKHDKNY